MIYRSGKDYFLSRYRGFRRRIYFGNGVKDVFSFEYVEFKVLGRYLIGGSGF